MMHSKNSEHTSSVVIEHMIDLASFLKCGNRSTRFITENKRTSGRKGRNRKGK